jgi:predicted aspartyl protease
MPEYDAENFDPPAPVVHVLLRNPATGASFQNVPMLIDIGTDATAIPNTYAEQLDIDPMTDKTYIVEGFDGQTRISQIAEAEMEIAGRLFRGQFLLLDQAHGYLGRNVLNQLRILLDGPRRKWSEQ